MKSIKPRISAFIAAGLLVLSLMAAAPAQAQESERNGQPYFTLSAQVASADAAKVDRSASLPAANILSQSDSFLDTKLGWGVTGAVGWLYDSNWRFEVELGSKAFQLHEAFGAGVLDSARGEWIVQTFFVNGGYDFRGDSFITPYVEMGVGVGLHELTLTEIATVPINRSEQFQVTPALQVKTGVNLEVAEDWDVFMGYRFTTLINPHFNTIDFELLNVHHFEAGFKFYIEDLIYD